MGMGVAEVTGTGSIIPVNVWSMAKTVMVTPEQTTQ